MNGSKQGMLMLSLRDIQLLLRQKVENLDLFETDYALGRCPFCHGRHILVDPVIHDCVPCICTGVDPTKILGTA
ncbi:MAG: hypothetical protein DRJ03_01745 [Chloroflexi bacterium]|nr:MAG: hypothetical protein DRJ03_01745 [Chloroflexota bacterium]